MRVDELEKKAEKSQVLTVLIYNFLFFLVRGKSKDFRGFGKTTKY